MSAYRDFLKAPEGSTTVADQKGLAQREPQEGLLRGLGRSKRDARRPMIAPSRPRMALLAAEDGPRRPQGESSGIAQVGPDRLVMALEITVYV